MKSFACILVALGVFPALAQTTVSNNPVVAAVEASKTGAPISPHVYGQFIEHAGNIIYAGLWSERLDDRKF